jgi:hypothetical protein
VRAAVVGLGAVGARAARQLLSLGPLDELVVVDADGAKAAAGAATLGQPAVAGAVGEVPPSIGPGDVVVLAHPGVHHDLARTALARGAHLVSVADGVDEVQALLALDGEARTREAHLVVGAGFSPGLSCVLAALAARSFEQVTEIHVAKVGTGGPACARQHHRALGGPGLDWRDGEWERRRGGSGRELCWFPDPVLAVDCYRAALPEALLLAPAFPAAARVTARMGATRRDRLTARLPMLRRPHPEGGLGALRVEVRGVQGRALDDRVLGVVDRPAVAAGTVAALAARWALDRRLGRPGAAGLAALVDPGSFLATLADRGVKVAVFEGAGGPPPLLARETR